MRRLLVIVSLISVLSAPVATDAAETAQPQQKQPPLAQIKPRKPVKIRLKRTAKDDYSWELTGDDADEIVRVDKKLRKLLNVP